MEQSIDALRTALRVLTAIVKMRTPRRADLAKLRRLAPLLADAPLDELAFWVLRQAVTCAQLVVDHESGIHNRKAAAHGDPI
jgi:hypothetical protein